MTLEIADRVFDFLRLLAPEPRREVRRALRRLAEEKGDIKPLRGELAGYWRLRALNYLVIFRYEEVGTERTARCLYAAPRSVVYPQFQRLLIEFRPPLL